MRARIVATGISVDDQVTSSIEHAVIAGTRCIENAGIDLQEVDYLLNVGVYRDSNMVEPSMAALIQKGIGINRDFTRFPVKSPAFSTDLMNGAAGAINAFHVADGLFRAGRKGYVLVVSSDVHPSGKPAEGFSINPCGAAVLLAPAEGDSGFCAFSFEDSPEDCVGQQSYVDFEQHGTDGRNHITVETFPGYDERLLAFARDTAAGFIEQHQIDVASTALIAPTFTQTFASELGQQIGFDEQAVVNNWAVAGNVHTSSFGLGFDLLESDPAFNDYQQVLVVGAGAGIHAGCALYRR